MEKLYDIPLLPNKIQKNIFKKYHKSEYDSSHIRYNFQEIYKKRKIFRIDYSFFPYKKIDQKISYNRNAKMIYNSTGMLNITKLNYYYNKTNFITLKINHIHLAMAFDKNYTELSTISIASILNVSSQDTFIHFHILCINLNFKDMKKIIYLKKINKNVEFIFYNAMQAIHDFGERGKKEERGIGNYAKILAPQIVNNTNRILIIDSGDVIAQKDISEIYFYDIGENYFAWILEDVAGNYKNKIDYFFSNNLYPNAGICLVNVRLFRKDELYKKAFFVSISYKNLVCPFQDILLSISIYKFKYMPLKYNCKLLFDYESKYITESNITKQIKDLINTQKYSPFKYSIKEIIDAAKDPVINHFYHFKIYKGINCNTFTIQWIKYAKLTGLYKIIKNKYPKPFKKCKYLLKIK